MVGVSAGTAGERAEWIVTIRAFGPADEPGEARYEQYTVEAEDAEAAKEAAVEKDKDGISGVIGRRDSWEVVEVSGPHELRADGGLEREVREPPTVSDITHDRVTKLWLRCPECGRIHELWPKEMQDLDDLGENVLIERVLECYLSHDWTPDSWEEAHERGLVPQSWVEDDGFAEPEGESNGGDGQ